MGADKELVEALSRLNVNLNRLDRGNFINFMLTQQMAERATPTNVVWGNAFVNTNEIKWVQILQRNMRRKYVQLVLGGNGEGAFIMISNSDTNIDAQEAANQYANSSNGASDLILGGVAIFSGSSNPITVESTGPIYVAGFNITSYDPPVIVPIQTSIQWQEAILSDLDAIPGFMVEHRKKAGDIDKLTAGTLEESIIGKDFESAYGRGGVR